MAKKLTGNDYLQDIDAAENDIEWAQHYQTAACLDIANSLSEIMVSLENIWGELHAINERERLK